MPERQEGGGGVRFEIGEVREREEAVGVYQR